MNINPIENPNLDSSTYKVGPKRLDSLCSNLHCARDSADIALAFTEVILEDNAYKTVTYFLIRNKDHLLYDREIFQVFTDNTLDSILIDPECMTLTVSMEKGDHLEPQHSHALIRDAFKKVAFKEKFPRFYNSITNLEITNDTDRISEGLRDLLSRLPYLALNNFLKKYDFLEVIHSGETDLLIGDFRNGKPEQLVRIVTEEESLYLIKYSNKEGWSTRF